MLHFLERGGVAATATAVLPPATETHAKIRAQAAHVVARLGLNIRLLQSWFVAPTVNYRNNPALGLPSLVRVNGLTKQATAAHDSHAAGDSAHTGLAGWAPERAVLAMAAALVGCTGGCRCG